MARIRIRTELGRFERALCLALLLATICVGVAYAAYSGPNRTTTVEECETECVPTGVCYYHGTQADSPGYSCTITAPCGGNPGSSQWSVNRCGWPSGHGGVDNVVWGSEICEERRVCQDVTVSLPPASVSGQVNCSGENGWCQAPPSLQLSGSEPLSGFVITQIESDAGGLCAINAPSGSCAAPVDQGEGSFVLDVWAVSSYGDSSYKQTVSWKQDSQPPSLEAGLPSPDGANGWYRGPVTLSATGSDDTSGLAAAEVAVEGAWATSPVTLSNDGQWSVAFRTRDLAGHSTSSGEEIIRIDATPPTQLVEIQGLYANGWYGSQLNLVVTGSDATSGVAQEEVNLDGYGWSPPGSYTLSDGEHLLAFRTTDQAGNTVQESQTIQVDASPPEGAIALGDTCVAGMHRFQGWARDEQSGVASALLSMGGIFDQELILAPDGTWSFEFDSDQVADGVYPVSLQVSDQAGNTIQADQIQLEVDNQAPRVSLPARWAWQQAGELVIEERESGLKQVLIELSNASGLSHRFELQPNQVPEAIAWAELIPEVGGRYPDEMQVQVIVIDQCWNRSQVQAVMFVPPAAATDTSEPVTGPILGEEAQPALPPSQPSQALEEPAEPIAEALWMPRFLLAPIWLSPSPLWGLLVLGLVFMTSLIRDRRSQAIRELAQTLDSIRQLQSNTHLTQKSQPRRPI